MSRDRVERGRWTSTTQVGFLVVTVAAMAWGASHSQDPLIRVACGLAVLSLALAGFTSWVGNETWRRTLVLALAAIAVIAIPGSLALGLAWGGGALNGRIDDDRYYLVDHGVDSETSRLRYWTMATLETGSFVAMPALFLLLALEDRRSRAAG